jgi:hypothetical protein
MLDACNDVLWNTMRFEFNSRYVKNIFFASSKVITDDDSDTAIVAKSAW